MDCDQIKKEKRKAVWGGCGRGAGEGEEEEAVALLELTYITCVRKKDGTFPKLPDSFLPSFLHTA